MINEKNQLYEEMTNKGMVEPYQNGELLILPSNQKVLRFDANANFINALSLYDEEKNLITINNQATPTILADSSLKGVDLSIACLDSREACPIIYINNFMVNSALLMLQKDSIEQYPHVVTVQTLKNEVYAHQLIGSNSFF